MKLTTKLSQTTDVKKAVFNNDSSIIYLVTEKGHLLAYPLEGSYVHSVTTKDRIISNIAVLNTKNKEGTLVYSARDINSDKIYIYSTNSLPTVELPPRVKDVLNITPHPFRNSYTITALDQSNSTIYLSYTLDSEETEIQLGTPQSCSNLLVSYNPKEDLIFIVDSETFRIYNLRGDEVCKYLFKYKEACCAAISRDGESIAVGFVDGSIKVWNKESDSTQQELQYKEVEAFIHESRVISLDFYPVISWIESSPRLLSSSLDGTIKSSSLKEFSSATLIGQHSKAYNSSPLTIKSLNGINQCYNPSFISISNKGEVCMKVDLITLTSSYQLLPEGEYVKVFCLDTTKTLAFISGEHNTLIWDIQSRKVLKGYNNKTSLKAWSKRFIDKCTSLLSSITFS